VLGDVVLSRWCVCRCLLGDGLPFVFVSIHRILKESYASVFGVEVHYSVCRLIFLIVQLSYLTSQGLCFMAVRMSKCRVNSALMLPLPQNGGEFPCQLSARMLLQTAVFPLCYNTRKDNDYLTNHTVFRR